MNSHGNPPLFWALVISILIHLSALPFAIFDNNLPNEKRNEQLINITLEPMEMRNQSSPQPMEPIPRARLSEPLLPNDTVLKDIVPPQIAELSKLPNFPDQKVPLSHIKPISKILPQLVQTPTEPENNINVNRPDRLHEPSDQQSLEPVSTVDQELTQLIPPPPQPFKHALPEAIIKDQRQAKKTEPVSPVDQDLTKLTPLPPQPSKSSLPETINKDQGQAEKIEPIQQSPIIHSVPPKVNKPLPQESVPVAEVVEEETDLNASASLNNSLAKEYATILHNTLNKRVKRKYPRKAIQNCIEGTVTVQIQISPSGEQLAYDILNANEAPSILRKATEKLLDRHDAFSSFNEDLSDQPMTFQVNLVYRLPQCAK